MSEVLNHVAQWRSSVRALVTVGVGVVALLAWVSAFRCSARAGAASSSSAVTLLYSGWQMSTGEVLQGWAVDDERTHKLRSASWTFRFDMVASTALAAVLFGCCAAVRDHADLDAITNLGEAAAWLALVSALSSVIGDFALVSVIRGYRKQTRVSWIGISVAMTMLVARVASVAGAMIYVLTGAAAL